MFLQLSVRPLPLTKKNIVKLLSEAQVVVAFNGYQEWKNEWPIKIFVVIKLMTVLINVARLWWQRRRQIAIRKTCRLIKTTQSLRLR